MQRFWKVALDEVSAGRSIFIVIVAAAEKGSPGTPAARMLVKANGEQVGTIGGGIMEKDLLDEANAVLAAGQRHAPELRRLQHTSNSGVVSSGLICGGEQSNVLFTLDATDVALLTDLADYEAEETEVLLKVSSVGLSVEFTDADFSSDLELTGAGWCYRFNFVRQRRIAIFGAGHCGVALALQMHRLDYAVTLVDLRADLFTVERLLTGCRALGGGLRTGGCAGSFFRKKPRRGDDVFDAHRC